MERRNIAIFAGGGCAVLLLVAVAVGIAFFLGVAPLSFFQAQPQEQAIAQQETLSPGGEATQLAVPTLPAAGEGEGGQVAIQDVDLTQLYDQLNPGVVSIQVFIAQGEQTQSGGGSGFILDEEGHIVTNNHVVSQADRVSVVFFNGYESLAEVAGTDPDSDLAVLRVEELPENTYPLPLGDSDTVAEGQWVVAIGNPFGLEGSMTTGIVSAIGRSIPSGATPFQIPQAIQTDAAINPGNSGGPLLNLTGEVIGVNAQIASSGTQANSGVGFAIPSNVVREVIPVLIQEGQYAWPWLGIRGGSVNLLYQQANNLDSQEGAFITNVAEGGPADKAGLQGAEGSESVGGIQIPVGGDVVIGFEGQPVENFADLLYFVSSQRPDQTVTLTLLRDGEEMQIDVTLEARPDDDTTN